MAFGAGSRHGSEQRGRSRSAAPTAGCSLGGAERLRAVEEDLAARHMAICDVPEMRPFAIKADTTELALGPDTTELALGL